MSDWLLTSEQARVLGALVEKSITTPAYYPMTVNAIVNACNQKSCRLPTMQLSEGQVGSALLDLSAMNLVAREDAGGRVAKWRQRMRHQMLLAPHTQAVLVTLMLRGPQTPAELRSNAASLNGPDDIAAVHAALEDLRDRGQPLVVTLERQAGQKEARSAHLLCGEPEIPEPTASSGGGSPSRLAALEERVTELEEVVARLRESLGEG